MAKDLEQRVGKLIWALNTFQSVVPKAALNHLTVFLTVATEPGITVGEVNQTLGMPPTSTARALSVMFKKARKKPGFDLIETRPDFEDGRIKHCHLTPKGERLWNNMRRILEQ